MYTLYKKVNDTETVLDDGQHEGGKHVAFQKKETTICYRAAAVQA